MFLPRNNSHKSEQRINSFETTSGQKRNYYTMIVDSSRYQTNDIIKVQAFVRGYLCRERVVKMVEKRIDEILMRLGRPRITTEVQSKNSGSAPGIKKFDVGGANSVSGSTDEVQSRNSSRQQLTRNDKETITVIDPLEHSNRSMSSFELRPNEMGESFKINEESAHGSVSSIRSKFESKKDPNAPVPTRSWSKRKLEIGKNQEENQEEKQGDKKPINPDQKQPPTIQKQESAIKEEKYSELPAAQHRKTNSYVKNLKLRSNATKNVSSSEKVLEEQEMRMNNEIQQLLKDINRIGQPGEPSVAFGKLFDDEKVANYYEALAGTLKAAKKKKIISYDGQFLLKGMSDNVVISII